MILRRIVTLLSAGALAVGFSTSRRGISLVAALVSMVSMAGAATGGVAAAASTASPARPSVGQLAVTGGTLPAATVGQPYSYQFHVADDGAAAWTTLVSLPLGLVLDRNTGVLSGIPEEAGTQYVIVSAARGGAHAALGSGAASLTVNRAASGAATIWGSPPQDAGNAAAPRASDARPAASGTVTVKASDVAASLYQALYFQAVDNPKALPMDLVNVLLADVAAQVYATSPTASASSVETSLAALKSAFDSATNRQAPSSAGHGLPSFGPNLVAQLTGAIGVMSSFATSSEAGVSGPAARSVAASIYDAYLKTSIATGIGFSTGYAGFSDRALADGGDSTGSGFHALVSGPAIQRAVACGQAIVACAAVEDSLLTPVVRGSLGAGAAVSVASTAARLKQADPALAAMLSDLKVTLRSDGSLALPSGGIDPLLTAAGNRNVSLTSTAGKDVKQLVADAGDPVSPADVSQEASTDLSNVLPLYNEALTGTVFSDALASKVPDGSGVAGLVMDGSAPAQSMVTFLAGLSAGGNQPGGKVRADLGLGSIIGTITGNTLSLLDELVSKLKLKPDEPFLLAQQTDAMIGEVFTDLSQNLKMIQGSIQNVQATLADMFAAMQQGFADIDFTNHQILAGLTNVEITLGKLQYQVDLTDGDVVAFGEGQIQGQIKGTINQCLDRSARNLAPLDFTEFSDCASQFKTEAETSASNDVVEFTTPPPAAPGNGDLSADGTVATTLAAHGLDSAKNLSYLLSILHNWYGLGTDPAGLASPLVNPGVWSEVALGYRELLDEYPQFSAGDEPDLPGIEAPGQQVAQLISALQHVDPTAGTSAVIQQLGANYGAAFSRLTADINAHQGNFPTGQAGADNGYGTPSAQSWAGYNPADGIGQTLPAGADPFQQVSSFASCDGGNPVNLHTPQAWEQGVILPGSWFILFNLVGAVNGSIQPLDTPICYTYSATPVPNPGCIRIDGTQCPTFDETGALDVRFMGTDGAVHRFHHIQLGTTVLTCHGTGACSADTPTEFYNNILNTTRPFGGFSALETVLSANGGNTQPATTDVLDSEATQILAAGLPQVYKWDVNGLTDAHTQDNPALAADAGNLTGAFELIQLAAQALVPASSLSIRSVSDILYGQDQLPTSLTGPNNPVSVFQALAAGTGTQTLDQYASVQQGRLAQLELLLNVVLAAQQAASGGSGGGSASRASSPADGTPPTATIATAEAPALTYSVLDQLAAGALLDTDTVTVKSPGALASVIGASVSRQLSASSSAGAKITSWSATGLPPGLSLNGTSGKVTGKPTKTGTFTVKVKATDIVGVSLRDSGTATFTWKVLAACGTQLIGNGGLESGTAPWAITSGVRVASSKATPAFAGKWLARLGGRTAPRTDGLSQAVTIACGNATLSYELRVISSDPKTKASDTMTVQVASSSGKVLKTLATVSNKNAAANYARFSFSLKPWIGQQVTIRFASSETLKGHATSFLVDNVAVTVN